MSERRIHLTEMCRMTPEKREARRERIASEAEQWRAMVEKDFGFKFGDRPPDRMETGMSNWFDTPEAKEAAKDQRIFELEVAQDRLMIEVRDLTAGRDQALDRVRVLELTAAMSESMAVGPHDFDEHLRICKRCGASTREWVDTKAECGTGDLDLTGWESATPQEKHERRARNIAQAAAREERGKTAAVDDFAFINRKLAENEKEKAAEWNYEHIAVPFPAGDFSTADLIVKGTERWRCNFATGEAERMSVMGTDPDDETRR